MNINFTSTYRIPITQAGTNNAKKDKLRNLVSLYPNSIVSKQKTGFARLSIPNTEDAKFEGKLKGIGYKVFQKFDGENVPKDLLDEYIKEALKYGEFQQKGKQKAPKKTFQERP